MTQLIPLDHRKYVDALLDAFRKLEEFEDLYRSTFGEDLTKDIPANSTLNKVANDVLNISEARDQLEKLISIALEMNPTNEKLKALIVKKDEIDAAQDKNPENVIGFVNRKKELDSIFLTPGQSSRYWVVDAPAGYGKSQLLDEAIKKYKEDEWLTVKVVFPRHVTKDKEPDTVPTIIELVANPIVEQLRGAGATIDTSDTMEVAGMEIAACILAATRKTENVNIKGIVIAVDNFEGCPPDEILQFVQMMSGIFTGLKNNHDFFQSKFLRVFIAGRYARNKIKTVRDQVMLVEMPLAPFTFDVMVDSIENFAISKGKSSGFPQARDIAAHVMFITGGHPGFVAKILAELAEDDFALGIYPLVKNVRQYQETFIEKFYGQLNEEAPRLKDHSLIDILFTLSPFRKYDRWVFLKELRASGYLSVDLTEEAIEKGLLSTYLVDRDGGFLHDGIYRYLLEIWLRLKEPELYARLCESGLDIYKKQLSNAGGIRSIEIWAVEFIYLSIVQNYHVLNVRGGQLVQKTRENLLWVINRLADMKENLSAADIENVREDFLKELNADDELRFLYNFGVGEKENFDSSSFENLLAYANQEFDRLL